MPLAALEEGADVLEDIVDGLLHLEGEGVTVVPENNKEEALGEVSKGCEVSNTCQALQQIGRGRKEIKGAINGVKR